MLIAFLGLYAAFDAYYVRFEEKFHAHQVLCVYDLGLGELFFVVFVTS